MEFLAKLLNPLAIGLFTLAVLVFARALTRRRPYRVADLKRLGISLDDIRLSTGEDRGPVGQLESRRRGFQLVSDIPTEDRVMILALDFFRGAMKCSRPAEAIAALRIAENLVAARSAEPLAA